jgi:hypothetical protein
MLLHKRFNLLLFIFSCVVACVIALPILKAGLSGVYYAIDPEMAYISNALTYTKYHLIGYVDHPGTPLILFLSWSYIPLRIFAKYYDNIPFILWCFNNLTFLFFYTRIVMIFLFAVSIFVYFLAAIRITSYKSVPILVLLGLSTFPFVFRLSGEVLAESMGFFVISIWLYFFSLQDKIKSPKLLFVLSFISGCALAVKFNNIVIAIASIALIISYSLLSIKSKILYLFLNLILVVLGFICGSWAVKNSYISIFGKIIKVAIGSGDGAAHGSGTGGAINTQVVYYFINLFWQSYRPLAILFIVTSLLLIYFVLRKKIRVFDKIFVLFVSVCFSILFMTKYPNDYYQFPNVLILVFVNIYILKKYINNLTPVCILLFTPVMITNLFGHYRFLENNIDPSIQVAKYQISHPSRFLTLYDYAPVKDFMLIWMRYWGFGLFDEQLIGSNARTMALEANYKDVTVKYDSTKNISDVCWDKLYIRSDRAKEFLNLYPNYGYSVEKIGNSGIWVVNSSRCKPTI